MTVLDDLQRLVPGSQVAQYDSPVLDHAVLKAYAEASGDLNPLHLDPDFARQAGFEDVIVQGMLGMAQLGQLLAHNFGQQSIRHFSARFVAVVPVGSVLRCSAWLTEFEEGGAMLKLEATVLAGDEIPEQLVISGQARIQFCEGS